MMPASTAIDEVVKECTPDERAAIVARIPPYDGVRTYGDLMAVRNRLKRAEKPKSSQE